MEPRPPPSRLGGTAAALGALLLLGVASCPDRTASEAPAAEPAAPVRLSIVFTADLRGTLEPCGCVKGQLGGLPRAAAFFEGQQDALWIDAGDTLAERAEADPPLSGQLRAKAEAVGGLLGRLGVVAIPGETDLGLAREAWTKDLGPRAVASAMGAAGVRRVTVGGTVVGLVGFSGPSASPEEVARAVRAAAAGLEDAPVRLALLHVGLDTARRAAGRLAGVVDAIVVGHLEAPTEGDRDVAVTTTPVPIFRPRSQGRDLGVLEVRLPPGAPRGLVAVAGEAARSEEAALLTSRIERMQARAADARAEGDLESAEALTARVHALEARRAEAEASTTAWPADRGAFTWRFVPMADSLPEATWAREAVRAYDRRLGALNLAWSKAHPRACPEPADGGARYVGGATCAGCHAEAAAVWSRTRHAAAWATLTADDKQYDLECVGCHVTGWELPGGVCGLDRLAPGGAAVGARDVQCEACHGPGSRHVAARTAAARRATIRRAVPAQVCRTCHVGEHSPHFEYDAYLPKILGPGHGRP